MTEPNDEFVTFVAPVIQDNPFGWGPCEMLDQFRDMPYQPFSKGDRLGKISDWTAVQDKKYASAFSNYPISCVFIYFVIKKCLVVLRVKPLKFRAMCKCQIWPYWYSKT